MNESKTSIEKIKRYFSTNGSLFPLVLKWRLVRIIACSLFVASVLPCLAGGSVSAASITLTVPGRLTLSIAPDGNFHESATAATVSVKSDAYSGYTLGVKSGESSRPALKNGSNTIPSISSAMAGSSFPVNTWGWLPSKLGGQANSQYQPGPTTSLVTIEKTASPNASTANSYTIKLGAKVNGTIPAGTYVNTFTFTATANPVPYTITYQGESAPGKQTGSGMEGTQITLAGVPTRDNYEFKGWCTVSTSNETCPSTGKSYEAGGKYTLTNSANNVTLYAMWKQKAFPMQSWGWSECSKLAIGDTVMLIDTRDNNTYRARKLADGNCWMIDNLRLGDSKLQNRTLTSANTDLNGGQETYNLPNSSKDGFKSGDYNAENIYVVEADSDKLLKVYGGYYTFNAATAGTGANVTGYYKDVPSSICPKGWRLPNGDAYSSDNDFKILNDALGNSSGSEQVAKWTAPDGPAFLRAGRLEDSNAYYQNGGGYYWYATSYGSDLAYILKFESTYVSLTTYARSAGFPVRCLAHKVYSINYNLNGGFGGPSPNPQTGMQAKGNVTLSSIIPTKSDHCFRGWCSVDNSGDPSSCAGTTYAAGASYPLSNGISPTLYAIWKKVQPNTPTTMQEFTGCYCELKMTTGQTMTLPDTRDNNSYRVRKLADGQCWMIDNLRLGGDQDITLLNSNTDLGDTASFTLPKNPTYSTQYNESSIYVDPDPTYGGYYNWFTATAGEGIGGKNSGDGITSEDRNTSRSICPKGWRLPRADRSWADSIDEFKNLGASYNNNFDLMVNDKNGPEFVLAGFRRGSTRNNLDYTGLYWSSSQNAYNSSYDLEFWKSDSRVQFSIEDKAYSISVRCVARE